MNPDKFSAPKIEKEGSALSFEVLEKRPGLTQFVFDHVIVAIDRSGRNVQDVPELLFGTYDYDPDQASMEKPSFKRKDVDMDYVKRCIEKVAHYTGDTQFWFDPYDGDAKLGEEANKKEARRRLFSRFFDIDEGPDGYGYIIKL